MDKKLDYDVTCVFVGIHDHPAIPSILRLLSEKSEEISLLYNTLGDFFLPPDKSEFISLELARIIWTLVKEKDSSVSSPADSFLLNDFFGGDEVNFPISRAELNIVQLTSRSILSNLSDKAGKPVNYSAFHEKYFKKDDVLLPIYPLTKSFCDPEVFIGAKKDKVTTPLRFAQITSTLIPFDNGEKSNGSDNQEEKKKKKAESKKKASKKGESDSSEQTADKEESEDTPIEEDRLSKIKHLGLNGVIKKSIDSHAKNILGECNAVIILPSDFLSLCVLFKSKSFISALNSKPRPIVCVSPLTSESKFSEMEEKIFEILGVSPSLAGLSSLVSKYIDRIILDRSTFESASLFVEEGIDVLVDDLDREHVSSERFLDLLFSAAEVHGSSKSSEDSASDPPEDDIPQDEKEKSVSVESDSKPEASEPVNKDIEDKLSKDLADLEDVAPSEADTSSETGEITDSPQPDSVEGSEPITAESIPNSSKNGDNLSHILDAVEELPKTEASPKTKASPSTDADSQNVDVFANNLSVREQLMEDLPSSSSEGTEKSSASTQYLSDIIGQFTSKSSKSSLVVNDLIEELTIYLKDNSRLANYALSTLFQDIQGIYEPKSSSLNVTRVFGLLAEMYPDEGGEIVYSSVKSLVHQSLDNHSRFAILMDLYEYAPKLVSNAFLRLFSLFDSKESDLEHNSVLEGHEELRQAILRISLIAPDLQNMAIGHYLDRYFNKEILLADLRASLLSFNAVAVACTALKKYDFRTALSLTTSLRRSGVGIWGDIVVNIIDAWDKTDLKTFTALSGDFGKGAVEKLEQNILLNRIKKIRSISLQDLSEFLNKDVSYVESLVGQLIFSDQLDAVIEQVDGRLRVSLKK